MTPFRSLLGTLQRDRSFELTPSRNHHDRAEGEWESAALSLSKIPSKESVCEVSNRLYMAARLGPSWASIADAVPQDQLFVNMGINTIVMRSVARDPDATRGLLPAAIRAQAMLAESVLVIVPVFSLILPAQPVPLGYIVLAAAKLGIGAMSLPYLGVLSAHARYDRLAATELWTAVSSSALIVAAATLGGDVSTFLWAHVVASGIAVVVARRVARPLLPAGAGPRVKVLDLLKEAAPFGATAAVQSVYTRSISFAWGRWLRPSHWGPTT